ncbi:MAG: site-specific DNA-methyltransferase [Chloroflexota bacterium]|nr:site-specific DNA-methyltransferase [Chloroflexota bacterium]
MTSAPNWANRTIWTGDNLDILRGMNSETVDLVYLDPPFNSNKDYAAPVGSEAAGAAFKDTWSLSDLDVAWMGLIADEEPAVAELLNTAGRTHSKGMQSYLTMMAVRLLEMRRVLKPTGSIYLHCDTTASHYVKGLMDAIFGQDSFRSDISWKRTSAHSDTKQGRRQHGRIHDVLLYYTVGNTWTWNPIYTDYDPEYVENFYRHREEGTGRLYRKGDLTAARPGGDTEYEWRVKRRTDGEWEADLSNEWRSPHDGWEYTGVPPYKGRYWAYSQEGMREFAEEGRLVYAKTGMPNYKRYLDEMPGVPLQDMWTDITPMLGKRERVGYPTQKPLALLERIIEASSSPGDVVLDPFCGCATACVAAESLDRQWVGIDLSSKAVELVNLRLRGALGDLFHHGFVATRTDIPRRTDIDAPKNYRQNAHVLYGEQEGCCAGCGTHFEFRHF